MSARPKPEDIAERAWADLAVQIQEALGFAEQAERDGKTRAHRASAARMIQRLNREYAALFDQPARFYNVA